MTLDALCRPAWLLLIVLVGCAAPVSSPTASPVAAPARVEVRKTLTIAQPRAREGFGPWFITGSARALQYEELHTNFLVSTDAAGNKVGQLAVRVPALEDGTIAILPDGRMQTTWNLQPTARWHDGAALTAHDVVFGWQVADHPELPIQRSPTRRAIEAVEALDSLTAVITYRTTFYLALDLGMRDFYLLPQHLLAGAFQGDKEAFTRLPYFSTEYVHTGPFRLAAFVPGENLVLERFDGYFRGRPRIDTIVVRFIADNNAIVSNLLAGAVDIAGELPDHIAARLRDEWKSTGAGYVLSQPGSWRFISVQFNPQWGRPAELQRDVRIRRGLLLAIDRDAIRETVAPGFPDTQATSFVIKGDPRAPLVGEPFGHFRYDPSGATRELADAGWRAGPDGRLLSSAGGQVQLDIRTTGEYETELSAVANDWRKLGIEVTQEVITRALSQDREYIAKFPTAEITAQGHGDIIFRRFDSRERALPERRYVGSNAGHYANPELDRLIDQLYATVSQRSQGLLMKEMGEILAADLPGLPMYFAVITLVALKHVRGLDDFPGAISLGTTGVGTTARNAHLWDRD